MNQITAEKLEKYISITEKALEGIKIKVTDKQNYKKGQEVFDMASRYLSDARHYKAKGDFVTAFAAVNYAHGWLDAGARLNLFEVDKEVKELFTID